MRKISVFLLLVVVLAVFVLIARSLNARASSNNIDSTTYLPIVTSIGSPTATATNVATSTSTSTLVPFTGTPSPTPTQSIATASSPSGIGVVGDSASHPYQCIGRGGANSYAWTEVFEDWRGVNFADTCNGYIVAHSGDTTENIAGQVAQLTNPIQNGEIGKVIIFIGANDIYPVCYVKYEKNSRNGLYEDMLARLEQGVDDLIALGMLPENIYMVDQADRTEELECTNAVQFSGLVDDLNQAVTTMGGIRGFNVLNVQDVYDELATYYVNSQNDLMINGQLITNANCDETTCFYVEDGHLNTVGTAILANALFADVLNVPRLTDKEILQAAGIVK